MTVISLGERVPNISPAAWVAPNAVVVGDVTIGPESSVWYGTTLRGDTDPIKVGHGSNIQDGSVLHADPGVPCTLGDNVTIGHMVMLHGCTIEDGCLIGIGAVVLNGAVIGHDSLVAAGSLVTMNTVIPPRSMVMGSPAKVKRELTDEEIQGLHINALHYRNMRLTHAEATND